MGKAAAEVKAQTGPQRSTCPGESLWRLCKRVGLSPYADTLVLCPVSAAGPQRINQVHFSSNENPQTDITQTCSAKSS